jgi:WD40 repeat protein
VYVWDQTANSVVQIRPPEVCEDSLVTDLQWDPLSEEYVLATYSNGFMALLEPATQAVHSCFRDEKSVPRMACWLPTLPGHFVTIDGDAACLTLWTVSQSDFVERINLKRSCGLVGVKLLKDTNKLALAFVDGCVAVYSISQKKLLLTSEPGHSETVYDCKFKPSSADVLATASYDGSVKIWDTQSKECMMELKSGQDGMLYSLAWAPKGEGSDERLVASSSSGRIFMWDTKKGKILHTFTHHSQSCYRVAWNFLDENLLASTSDDRTCVVFTTAGKVLQKYLHPEYVFGIDWHPTNKNVIATACNDGHIRIFDLSQTTPAPILVLKGHTSRAFNVAWSPLLPNMLASTSDDKTLRIWEVGKTQEESRLKYTLEGHTNNVRAVLWSTEAPFLLFSGSWDGTIRMWDLRSRYSTLVETTYDHLADVYGLAAHPSRPFLVVSSSRDTSLRFWNMSDSLFAPPMISCVLNGGQFDPESLGEVAKNMVPETPLQLCGKVGRALSNTFAGMKEEERTIFASLWNYATDSRGVREFWGLVEALEKEGKSTLEPPPATRRSLIHVNDLRTLWRAKAEQLQEKKFALGHGHPTDRAEEAAAIHLKLGNVREYCEIMAALGRWEQAIAMGPAVSTGYWQQLCQRYVKECKAKGDHPTAVPFMIAVGDVDGTVESLNGANDVLSSLIVAVGESVEVLPVPQDEEVALKEEATAPRDDVLISERVTALINNLSATQIRNGEPICAACSYLSIGDTVKAVETLYNGNEITLATALCRVLKEDVDYITIAMARRCEESKMWSEALSLLANLPEPTKEVTLLCARFEGSTNEKADYYNKAGIPSLEELLETAEQATPGADAVRTCVVARLFKRAASIGLELLRDAFSKADKQAVDMAELGDIVTSLNSVDARILTPVVRAEVLCFSYYFGLLKALELGYLSVAAALANYVRTLAAKYDLAFGISMWQLRLHEAEAQQGSNAARANKLVEEILAEPKDVPPKTKVATIELQKKLQEGGMSAKTIVVPTGGALPSGNARAFPRRSVLTGTPVQFGAHVVLLDNVTIMSKAEFVQWTRVTPFAPTHTGERAGQYDPFASNGKGEENE